APGVAELGGLHVLATERHDARRIDRQLFGRGGRQGDRGSFQAIVSLEDEIVQETFGGHATRLARLLHRRPGRLPHSLGAPLVAATPGEIFGQQVIVENRASASGVIAGEITAKAPPDGYTLLLAYHQHTINAALSPNLPYHPVNDFTPITQLTRAGLLLVVNPSSPPRTLQEFIAWTKSRSGELNYGSAGLGSGGHLA